MYNYTDYPYCVNLFQFCCVSVYTYTDHPYCVYRTYTNRKNYTQGVIIPQAWIKKTEMELSDSEELMLSGGFEPTTPKSLAITTGTSSQNSTPALRPPSVKVHNRAPETVPTCARCCCRDCHLCLRAGPCSSMTACLNLIISIYPIS